MTYETFDKVMQLIKAWREKTGSRGKRVARFQRPGLPGANSGI